LKENQDAGKGLKLGKKVNPLGKIEITVPATIDKNKLLKLYEVDVNKVIL
jgi:hypothetical protein